MGRIIQRRGGNVAGRAQTWPRDSPRGTLVPNPDFNALAPRQEEHNVNHAKKLSGTLAIVFAAAAAGIALGAAAQEKTHSAVTPAERSGWVRERFEQMNERVKQGEADLIFIGDSITQAWEGAGKQVWEKHYGGRKAVNLGISGDRTQHVLWRIDHGNIDGISPKVAVIMIGTNNSNGGDNSATEIADGIRAIVGRLRSRLPDTKILLLDIFPRGEKPNSQRGKILQVNQMVRRLHDGEHLHYLAIGQHFINDDGSISKEIMPDFLHLTPKGYQIWADAIEDKLKEMLDES